MLDDQRSIVCGGPVATVAALSNRLRAELGDLGRSFVETFTGDGTTTRYQLSEGPVSATGFTAKVNNVDVTSNISVELTTGMVIFNTAPANNSTIVFSGTMYRYFTDEEIEYYVDTAFCEHTRGANTSSGSLISLRTLPTIDEYPLVILATSMALYTLATDSAFDIDIISPDGVSIPRSERFRQLMEIMQVKKEQYRELCSLLGTGLYRIEVFNLRRISRMTNRYVPVYLPMEVDDRSLPQRAIIPLPSYGSEPVPTDVATYDFNMYQGDSFQIELDFPFNVTGYTWKSAITQAFGGPKVQEFTITQSAADKLVLALTKDQTSNLPERCYWDIQFTAPGDPNYQKTYMRGKIFVTRQATT